MADFLALIRSALQQRDWNQSDLARATGYSRASISRILLGEQAPTSQFVDAAAHALALDPKRLREAAALLTAPAPERDDQVEYLAVLLDEAAPATRQLLLPILVELVRAVEALSDDLSSEEAARRIEALAAAQRRATAAQSPRS